MMKRVAGDRRRWEVEEGCWSRESVTWIAWNAASVSFPFYCVSLRGGVFPQDRYNCFLRAGLPGLLGCADLCPVLGRGASLSPVGGMLQLLGPCGMGVGRVDELVEACLREMDFPKFPLALDPRRYRQFKRR